MNTKVLKNLKNLATSQTARKVLVAQKHSPQVLFGAGVVGMVATVVLASKATLKLEEKVLIPAEENLSMARKLHGSDAAPDYGDKEYIHDATIIYTRAAGRTLKLYAPAVLVGAASVAALTGSHIILNKRYAGVVAAYTALEKGLNEYRERVLGEVGEDRERELFYGSVEREIVEETETGPQTKHIKTADKGQTPSMYARFFDEYSTAWNRKPEYNLLFLRCQQNYANDKLKAQGHLFLNEVYDMLGLERTTAGSVVGWIVSKEGDNYVDFGVFDGDNPRARDFVNGREGSILLDFNVDGIIYDKI